MNCSLEPVNSPKCETRLGRDGKVVARAATISDLVGILGMRREADRPIKISTGLDGRFDFTFESTPRQGSEAESIFSMLPKQFGLNLEPRRISERRDCHRSHRATVSELRHVLIQSRTQVAIVGAGPAGLMLGHLLHLAGIDSVIVENRSRDYVVERVRAGVLEQGTVDLLSQVGVGDRLDREGMRHEGIYVAFASAARAHRIDMAGLTAGRALTVYGQNEVVTDLIAARDTTGRPLAFEAQDVRVADLATERRRSCFVAGDRAHRVECDFIAGCDGSHGVCRAVDTRRRSPDLSAHLSVRLAWHPRREPRRRRTSWSTVCTSAASRSSACDRPR